MAQSKPWTRNQKLILVGILVTFLLGVISFIVKINIDISYIKDEVDNIKIKNAEIEHLKVQIIDANITFDQIIDFPVACPEGCAISHINFSSRHTICSCFD